MKVMTIGMSPYNFVSTGRLHASILEFLHKKRISVFAMVWAHDGSYFTPDEKGRYFYELGGMQGHRDKIPLIPFQRGKQDSIAVYETIAAMEPTIIITVGELVDAGFMKAVRMFSTKPFRWISVLANYQYPVSDENIELIDDMDAILCASESSYAITERFVKGTKQTAYVGCKEEFYLNRKSHDTFRIMASGKNLQGDNLATIMEVATTVRSRIPSLELYLHTNQYDQGEYDLNIIKQRFDPKDEFIRFPTKYVSLFEGLSDQELALELNKSDVFVSVPLVAGTSMTIFEALACGCFPIMSECGSNFDIAVALEKHFGGKYTRNDFLVRSIPLLTVGETYINICDPEQLARKIVWAFENKEKHEGDRGYLSVFSQKHTRKAFLVALAKILEGTRSSEEVLCLETV